MEGGFQNLLESNFPCRFLFSTAHSSVFSLVLVYVCVCLLVCVCVRVCVGAELHEWGIFSFSWSEAVKRVYSRGDFSPCRSTMLLLWAQDNWLQLMTRTLRNQLKQWALQRENYSHTAACMSSSFRYDTEFYQTCQEHLQVIFHHMIKRKKRRNYSLHKDAYLKGWSGAKKKI